MRVFIAATVATALFSTGLLAAETTPPSKAPLAPGKAAGLKKAQDADDSALWWTLGGVAAVGIGILASGGGSGTPAAAVSTTATTAT